MRILEKDITTDMLWLFHRDNSDEFRNGWPDDGEPMSKRDIRRRRVEGLQMHLEPTAGAMRTALDIHITKMISNLSSTNDMLNRFKR